VVGDLLSGPSAVTGRGLLVERINLLGRFRESFLISLPGVVFIRTVTFGLIFRNQLKEVVALKQVNHRGK
jgi:hypothetical protein